MSGGSRKESPPRRLSRRQFLRNTAGAGLALYGASIVNPLTFPASRVLAAPRGKVLTSASQVLPMTDMDPVWGFQNLWTYRVFWHLYDRVVHNNPTGVEPGLATEWRALNNTTWQFKLRPGVRFHNGQALTVEDVKFSIDRLADPANTGNAFKAFVAGLKGADIVDSQTVNILFERPFAPGLLGLSMTSCVLSAQYYKENGVQRAVARPIGTGSFKFVEFKPGIESILERNSSWWRASPGIDVLVQKPIPDPSTRVTALLAGELDIAESVGFDAISRVRLAGHNVVVVDLPRQLLVEFNEAIQSPLKDKRVRQALNYAIDKNALRKGLYGGQAKSAKGQIVQEGVFGHNPRLRDYPYDPDRALRMLREARFPFDFEFEMMTWPEFGQEDVSVAVADQLSRIGVKVKVNIMDPAAARSQRFGGRAPHFFTLQWNSAGDAHHALQWFSTLNPAWPQYHPPENRIGFGVRDEWNNLITGAAQELDPRKREAMYHRVLELMNEDPPGIFTIRLVDSTGISKRVKGFAQHGFGFYYFHRVSVEG